MHLAPDQADVSGVGGELHFGSVADLTTEQVDTLNRLAGRMPVKPDVAVHDTGQVDLIYNLPDTAATDSRTVRLTMDSAGHVVSARDGDYWDDNNPKQGDYLRLLDEGFGE